MNCVDNTEEYGVRYKDRIYSHTQDTITLLSNAFLRGTNRLLLISIHQFGFPYDVTVSTKAVLLSRQQYVLNKM